LAKIGKNGKWKKEGIAEVGEDGLDMHK